MSAFGQMITSCQVTDVSADPMVSRKAANAVNDDSTDDARELEQVEALMKERLQGLDRAPATEAGAYQLTTGGSLLRARLALASGKAFGCSSSYRVAASAACELIHNASLVHDDLWDGDEARRGAPTVWKQFGQGVALCTGDLLLCAAFGIAADLRDARQSRLLSQQLATMSSRVIAGQSIELAPRANRPSPRFRDYLEATMAKSVPLIELPLLTGAVAGRADRSTCDGIGRLAKAIGLAYQIIDDLDDLDDLDGSGTTSRQFHPFHAWHHHRLASNEVGDVRVVRAARHALTSLKRSTQELARLEERMPGSLASSVQPILTRLTHRALAHYQRSARRQRSTINVETAGQ